MVFSCYHFSLFIYRFYSIIAMGKRIFSEFTLPYGKVFAMSYFWMKLCCISPKFMCLLYRCQTRVTLFLCTQFGIYTYTDFCNLCYLLEAAPEWLKNYLKSFTVILVNRDSSSLFVMSMLLYYIV